MTNKITSFDFSRFEKAAIFLLIFLVGSFLIMAGTSEARERQVLARPLGMGGAFTAVAEGPSALAYNPAGLYESGTIELAGAGGLGVDELDKYSDIMEVADNFSSEASSPQEFYEDLEASLPENVFGRAKLFGGGSISAVGGSLSVLGQLEGEIKDNRGYFEYEGITEIKGGLAADITDLPAGLGFAAIGSSFGLNRVALGEYELNYDEQNPDDSEMSEWMASDTGLALDAGMLLQVTPIVRAGLMIENAYAQDLEPSGYKTFYRPRTGVQNEENWEEYDEEEYSKEYISARKARIGVSVDLPVIGQAAADISNFPVLSSDKAPGPILHAGIETDLLLGLFSLRGGFNQGFGENDRQRMITGGLGINLAVGSVDIGAGRNTEKGETSVLGSVTLGF